MSQFILDLRLGTTPQRNGFAEFRLALCCDVNRPDATIGGIFGLRDKTLHFQWLDITIQGRWVHANPIGKAAD